MRDQVQDLVNCIVDLARSCAEEWGGSRAAVRRAFHNALQVGKCGRTVLRLSDRLGAGQPHASAVVLQLNGAFSVDVIGVTDGASDNAFWRTGRSCRRDACISHHCAGDAGVGFERGVFGRLAGGFHMISAFARF
ncbi:hypothetical protein [Pararhizobium capsulatum]|uniref:hypothetical protein n=1 Tax=Pararhizobium capsulatum TaxID=34014 RepID=UPI0027D7D8C8|nr:hypothetical protein [Pararhizobium capsulatum]